MEIITSEKLKKEIKDRKKFLRALKKEKNEQEKKFRKAQTSEEIKELNEIFRGLNAIEMGVIEEILNIQELLGLGVEKIIEE